MAAGPAASSPPTCRRSREFLRDGENALLVPPGDAAALAARAAPPAGRAPRWRERLARDRLRTRRRATPGTRARGALARAVRGGARDACGPAAAGRASSCSRCRSSRRRSAAPTRSSTSPTCARWCSTATSTSANEYRALLRARPAGPGRLQGHLPRPARAARPAGHINFAPDRLRAALVAVLPAGPRGRARWRARSARRSPADGFSLAVRGRGLLRLGALRLPRACCSIHDALARFGGFADAGGDAGRGRALAGHAAALLHDAGARLLARVLALRGRRSCSGCALRARARRGGAVSATGRSCGAGRRPRAAWCASRTRCSWSCRPGWLAWQARRTRGARGARSRGCAALGVAAALAVRRPSSSPTARSTAASARRAWSTRKLSYSSPHFLEVLFDPGHGLFVWSAAAARWPPRASLLRCVAPARRAGRAAGRWRCCCRSGSTARSRAGRQAGAFGSRRFVSATPVFAWGLAALVAAGAGRALRPLPVAAVAGALRVVERLADGPVRAAS